MASASARLCAVCGVVVPANFRFCPFCSSVIPIQPGEAERQRAALQALLGERIELHERIGRGGNGLVFRGTQRRTGRQVAVKVLHEAHGESELMRQRFLTGARVAAELHHPHLLPLLEIGAEGPLAFVVMPFVEGENLAALLLREGRLAGPEAVRILTEVAEALEYVHREGLVHRDVKPQHILLFGRARRVLLIDFSLACAAAGAKGSLIARLDVPPPEAGVVVGTPAYMSPEQAEGRPDLDARCDLYALGIVGYQMLTGALPFEGTEEEQLVAHRVRVSRNPALQFDDVPADLAAVVMRCVANLPANRWNSAAAFAAALKGGTDGRPSPEPSAPEAAPGTPAAESWPPPSLRRPTRPAVRYLTIPPPPPGSAEPAPEPPEPAPVVVLPPEYRVSRATGVRAEPATSTAAPGALRRNGPLWTAGVILLVLLGYLGVQGARRLRHAAPTMRDTAAVVTTAAPPGAPQNPGYLSVIVQPGGRVFVDGIEVGPAPVTDYALAPGRHRVRIERAGYRTDSVRVMVQAGVTVETRIALTPR
jgi:serine/threonine protein kinase